MLAKEGKSQMQTSEFYSKEETAMERKSLSVARLMVVAGLAIQILGLGKFILFDIGLSEFLDALQDGVGEVIAITVVLVGSLALLYPVIRGNRWATLLTIPLQALLTFTALPFFLDEFGKPAVGGFSIWIITVTLVLGGLTAIGFGIVAALEAFGRIRPAGFRAGGGGLSRQGAILGALACGWAGMMVLGYAVSRNPGGTALAAAPEEVGYLTAENTSFPTGTLEVQAGKSTAIFITNKDDVGHSFDIDALDVHVDLPAGATAVALVKPETAGALEFYCSVPGHKDAGMVGTLNAR